MENNSSSENPPAAPSTPAASVSSVPSSQTPPVQPTPTPGIATTPPVESHAEKAEQHKHGGFPLPLIFILLIFAFIGGILLAGLYYQMELKKVTQQKVPVVAQQKKIIIGTDATFQPMEYTNKEGGLIGYDIDLGYRISNELGSQAEFRNIPWDNLFKALEDKKIDMIISGVTITDERKQKYSFSDQYLNVGQVVITQQSNNTINSASTLQGKKIGVQQGTTIEKEALKFTSENLVIRFPDFVQATKALVDGKVDAILSDLPAAKGIITANPTLKIASDPLTNEYYGIVFRKDDPAVKRVNEILTSLRIKGILTDLKQKWLD